MRADPHGDLCAEVARVLGKPLDEKQRATVRQILVDFGRLRRYRHTARSGALAARHEVVALRLAKQVELNLWYLFGEHAYTVEDDGLEFHVKIPHKLGRHVKVTKLSVTEDYFRPLPNGPRRPKR